MDYNDKIITMDDNQKYMVIEQVNYENGTYLYLVNNKDERDAKFVKVEDDKIIQIDPKLFETKILPLFLDKMSKY